MRGVPGQVVADVEVEVAVAVEIGEGRRGRPVAIAAQSGALGGVLERAVAPVVKQGIRPEAGDEQVGAAVVVVVAHRHAEAVAAADPRRSRGGRRVLERAVAPVAEQAVAAGARTDRGRRDCRPCRKTGSVPPWTR